MCPARMGSLGPDEMVPMALLSRSPFVITLWRGPGSEKEAIEGRMTQESDLLRRGQVALLFGVSPPTVTRWAREGRIPSVMTPGGQRRYPKEAIQRLLDVSRRDNRS